MFIIIPIFAAKFILTMARPKCCRKVVDLPMMEGFKPFGVSIENLVPVILLFEEYEALRLLDYEGMTQVEAATSMNISRPTVTRVYQSARKNIAQAFVEGRPIFIEGGSFSCDKNWYRCNDCHKMHSTKTSIKQCQHCSSLELLQMTQGDKTKSNK